MVSNVCSICKGLWRCICGISESLGDNGIVPPSTDIRLMGPGSGTVTTLRGPAFRQPLEAPVVAGRWRPGREFPRADSADFRDRFTQTRGRGRCTFDEEPVVTECQPESQPPGNPSPGHPPDNQLPWYAQKRILIPTGAIAVVLVAVIAAIAGSTGEPVDGTPTPVAVASEEAGVEAADEQASADTAEQAAADEAAAIEEAQAKRAAAEAAEAEEAEAKEEAQRAAEEEEQRAAEEEQRAAEEAAESSTAGEDATSGSVAQRNALSSAERYLDFTAFSRSGLINQLEFEGFSTDDATWAVDRLTVDWREQALNSAANYLDFSAFSRSGLIDQLEFEGYSTDEATWGVDRVTVDWNEQAAKSAQNYLDFTSFSRSGLIDQLRFEGFTAEQAEYGVNQTGL